ncbi:oligosaccharide flippase family protein [Empedobacter falsenii]
MSQIKKGALLSYITIFLTNIIGLVLTPFIIRSLGDSEYGLYTLIGAFVGYLSIMDLGLNNTIVRYVSKYRAENDKKGEENFLGTTMMIYVLISLIIVIAGIVLYYQLDRIFGDSLTLSEMEKAKAMFVILIFNLGITLPGGAFTAICNAYEKFVFPRALNIIKYLIRSLLVYVILTQGADSIGLVILDTVVNLVTIALTFSYSFFKLKARFRFKSFNKVMVGEIFSYSMWIFILAIISQLQWKGGQMIIGMRLNTTEVAIYAVGIMLGTYYGAFSSAISSLFLPRATQMSVRNSSPLELTNMMVKIARFSLFTLMLVFVGFLFLGRDFIHLWINESYDDAYYIALIIMIGYTIPLIQTFANSLLEARKLFKFKAMVYLISLGTGTVLSYFFVREYGIISVILFIVSFWILGQIIMNIFFSKVLKLKMLYFFKQLAKGLFVVFVLMLLSGYFISLISIDGGWIELAIKACLLSAVYLALLFLIGMNKEEKEYVLLTFKR